jgi:hypothetical protein
MNGKKAISNLKKAIESLVQCADNLPIDSRIRVKLTMQRIDLEEILDTLLVLE